MLKDLGLKILIKTINRLLENDSENRDVLADYRLKAFKVCLPIGSIDTIVMEDGYLAISGKQENVDVAITIPSEAIASLPLGFEEFRKKIEIHGNADFAAALSKVFTRLHWDYEEDLSHIVGDIAAHRIGTDIRALRGWFYEVKVALSANAVEYVTEEINLVINGTEIGWFVNEVDEFRDSIERLEQRLIYLEK